MGYFRRNEGDTVMSIKKVAHRVGASLAAFATLAACASMALPASAAFAEEGSATNVALAKDNDNAPETTVSYDGATWSPAEAINDNDLANKNSNGGWGTWGNKSSEESATYTWQREVTTSSSKVWLYTNLPPAVKDGDGGILLPKSVALQYKDSDGNWKDAPNAVMDQEIPSELTENQAVYGPFSFSFDEIKTTAMKLTLQKQQADSKGITVTEWQVLGTSAPKPDVPADKGDPDEFLMTQEVYVRTTPDVDPTDKLPETIWAIPENGPLSDEKVTWDAIPAEDYATTGKTAEIKGHLESGTEVSATLQVLSELNQKVSDVESVSTITTPGVKPVLPKTVYLEYEDGSKESGAKVTWPEIPASDYATAEQDGFLEGSLTDKQSDVAVEGSFIVVEASAEDANPIISLSFGADALSASGWYTSDPTFTIETERGSTANKLALTEYRINGGKWTRYNEPVTLKNQGKVIVEGRVTDEAGHVATQTQQINVDTNAPTTEASVSGEGKTKVVTVTLNAQDGESGSGVTRTLWSSGPSDSPKSNENTMWGTYDAPFEVSLEKANTPYYVHFYSQDAAGHQEAYKLVKLSWDGSEAVVEEVLTGLEISGDGVKEGKLSLEEGKSAALSATAIPMSAKLPQLSWESSDETIATVDDSGKVVAVKPGAAVITVKAQGSEVSKSLAVTVTEKSTEPGENGSDGENSSQTENNTNGGGDAAGEDGVNKSDPGKAIVHGDLAHTGVDVLALVSVVVLLSAMGAAVTMTVKKRSLK